MSGIPRPLHLSTTATVPHDEPIDIDSWATSGRCFNNEQVEFRAFDIHDFLCDDTSEPYSSYLEEHALFEPSHVPETCDQSIQELPQVEATLDGLLDLILTFTARHEPSQYTCLRYTAIRYVYETVADLVSSSSEFRFPPIISTYLELLMHLHFTGESVIPLTKLEAQLEMEGVVVPGKALPSLVYAARMLVRDFTHNEYSLFDWNHYCADGPYSYGYVPGSLFPRGLSDLLQPDQMFRPALRESRSVWADVSWPVDWIHPTRALELLSAQTGRHDFVASRVSHPLTDTAATICTRTPQNPAFTMLSQLFPLSTTPVVLEKQSYAPRRFFSSRFHLIRNVSLFPNHKWKLHDGFEHRAFHSTYTPRVPRDLVRVTGPPLTNPKVLISAALIGKNPIPTERYG